MEWHDVMDLDVPVAVRAVLLLEREVADFAGERPDVGGEPVDAGLLMAGLPMPSRSYASYEELASV